ncbi:MAG: hypothetical protein ACJA0K_002925 [Maricaulis maris]|jgi:hypothetical protein
MAPRGGFEFGFDAGLAGPGIGGKLPERFGLAWYRKHA